MSSAVITVEDEPTMPANWRPPPGPPVPVATPAAVVFDPAPLPALLPCVVPGAAGAAPALRRQSVWRA
ncbi:hypothetical protein [Bradyrhizobium acaciae]|uniref:hypothetical protein n=1 Tax=Bradyrhizobium acaciae TaxID=2683706 RepID=UPI001E363767|nr:hypothetical protein [Bradyrhizobium acaciae]